MTERRAFNTSERVALYLVANGKCSACNIKLEPGWHADHRSPYSHGGITDVINGQALCPACNLKKGNKSMATKLPALRNWQKDALEKFFDSTTDFLCMATPGAGKTTFSLTAAKRLADRGEIQRIIIVVPTSTLRRQWADAALKFNIQLDPTFSNGAGALARDYDGTVVTYASVASEPKLYRILTSDRKTLVILDEIHHAGDKQKWGNAILQAFKPAVRRLALSGTPFRSDRTAIPFVEYDKDRQCTPNYAYDYGDAVADRENVVRQVQFHALDGEARWQLGAGAVEASMMLSSTNESTRAMATTSVLMPEGDWIPSVLRQANDQLTKDREDHMPDAGGLVVAADQSKARQYAEILENICGEKPTLVISDEIDSADLITEFASGKSRWIVAVAMVSEGVDIPRLSVGAYVTRVTTELFFKQVVGRLVRTRDPEDSIAASVYIPSTQPLLSYAAEIERMSSRALLETINDFKEDGEPSGDEKSRDSKFQPLGSGEAFHFTTILNGEEFTDAELRAAEEELKSSPFPKNTTAAQMALYLRKKASNQNPSSSSEGRADAPKPSLKSEKAQIRKLIRDKVTELHDLTDQPYEHIHGGMNRMFGGTVPTADLPGLKRRLNHLLREIEKRQR